MQVWNVLHVARWKYRTQKWRKKSPSGQPSHNFVGLYLHNWGIYRQSEKKLVKQQYLLHMSAQHGELRPTSGWDRFGSLGHPSYFQRLPRLGSVTARHVVVGVSQTLRRWTEGAMHLCSAGRPSRWALAHISSCDLFFDSQPYRTTTMMVVAVFFHRATLWWRGICYDPVSASTCVREIPRSRHCAVKRRLQRNYSENQTLLPRSKEIMSTQQTPTDHFSGPGRAVGRGRQPLRYMT